MNKAIIFSLFESFLSEKNVFKISKQIKTKSTICAPVVQTLSAYFDVV